MVSLVLLLSNRLAVFAGLLRSTVAKSQYKCSGT